MPVTQPCWAWERSYTCAAYAAKQDCSELEANPGCHFVRADCLTDQPCRTWERVYDCPVPEQKTDPSQFICDGDVYCIDGSCETIERTPNDEFKDAVVALNAMDQARREFEILEGIDEAIKRSKALEARGFRYSYDMLGEAALTVADADRYFQAYLHAIKALAEQAVSDEIYANPSISIKLSALCPRYEPLHHVRALPPSNHLNAIKLNGVVDFQG